MLPGTVPAPNDGGLLQETRLILGKFTAAPTLTRAFVIDALVRALKTNGTWSKRNGLWVHAAHNSQAGLINWINPGSLTLTTSGSIAFTADQGFTGNGTDALLSGGALNSAFPLYLQNDAHVMAWSLLDVTPANSNYLFGTSSGASNMHFAPENAASNMVARLNAGSDSNIANTDPRGLYTMRRNNSSNYQVWKNDAQAGSLSVTSAAPGSNPFRVLAHSSARSLLQVALTSIGGSLTDTEIEDDYEAFHDYLTAVGAI